MRHKSRLLRAALLPVFATLALAACGSASSTPSTAAPSSGVPAAAPSSPAAPAEPDTAAGAQAAASQILELYGAEQWSAVYGDLAPTITSQIPESEYVTVHQRCYTILKSYRVTDPVLSGNTAVVTVSLAGVASGLGSEPASFVYQGGRWLWQLSAQETAVYKGGAASALSTLKSQGQCQ